MDMSIVIPAFDENSKITSDIESAVAFLRENELEGEIIIVDDGSTDNTNIAAKNAADTITPKPELKVIRYEHHKGKGYAVRTGISKSSGKFVMFADSGSCIPYEYVLHGMELLQNQTCDIAHGSRKMNRSIIERPQSLYRRICSKLFHRFIICFMNIPAELTDTQCGFKIYKGDVARHLYGECVTNGFMFDIEIIMRAQMENYKIREFPVDWACDRDSRLHPTRSLWSVFSELMTIRKTINQKNKQPQRKN